MANFYCKNLVNGLSFHQTNLRFCTTLQLGQIISQYQEKPKELAEKIISLRKNIISNLKNGGDVPDGCKDCIYKTNEYAVSEKISKIDLYYWYHCNCGCFYCSYRDVTKGVFSDRVKEGNPVIYKTLKELYKHNEISLNDLHVYFGGGEIGVLKEFPKLIDLFLKNNVVSVWCESSGVKYSKSVEKLLKCGKGLITIAICSGDKDVYKKIKNRDKYKDVLKNLANYVKAAKSYKNNPNNSDNVISKYIILKGFNDNLEEVEKWLSESKKIGLTRVEISMEFCWGIQTKKGRPIEDYNFKIFEYVEKRCRELGLKLMKNSTSVALMEKGIY